jgi:hypothetical protein
MGSFLKGWLGFKDTNLLAYRLEEKFNNQMAEEGKDPALYSMLMSVIPVFAEKTIGCKPLSFVFIEDFKTNNSRLFELPSSPQMTPLGYGMGIHFSDFENICDGFGVTIERVLLKNDDIFMLDNSIPNILANVFFSKYFENEAQIGGNFKELEKLTKIGEFDSLFQKFTGEESHKHSNYRFEPLMYFGHCYANGQIRFYEDSPQGVDLILSNAQRMTNSNIIFPQAINRTAFFDLLELTRNLQREFYLKRDNKSLEGLSLFSFRIGENIFTIADYVEGGNVSIDCNNRFGMLLMLATAETGQNFCQFVYHTEVDLREKLTKLKDDVHYSS